MQCKPPAQINSLDFQPNWGMYVVLFVSVVCACVLLIIIARFMYVYIYGVYASMRVCMRSDNVVLMSTELLQAPVMDLL